jgi:hypothetical protein
LFDALIHFLRFLRFLRNGLGVKTSDGNSWLDRVKDAHAQSKIAVGSPPSAQLNGITELFDRSHPTTLGRATYVPGPCMSSPESESRVCAHSRLMHLRKKRNKSNKSSL